MLRKWAGLDPLLLLDFLALFRGRLFVLLFRILLPLLFSQFCLQLLLLLLLPLSFQLVKLLPVLKYELGLVGKGENKLNFVISLLWKKSVPGLKGLLPLCEKSVKTDEDDSYALLIL